MLHSLDWAVSQIDVDFSAFILNGLSSPAPCVYKFEMTETDWFDRSGEPWLN